MSRLLQIIRPLTKDEFVSALREEEKSRGIYDHFTNVRIDEIAARQENLNYYLAATKSETLANLIVGRPPGVLFKHALSKQHHSPSVVAELEVVKDELTQEVLKVGSLINSNFTLGRVYCPRRLVIPDNPNYFDDYGKDKLYAGNFHRFIAYAMWLEENPFQPIKVYYCEGADCPRDLS